MVEEKDCDEVQAKRMGIEGTVGLIDQFQQEVIITGMGHTTGHYAGWINRGAVRIEAIGCHVG